MKSAFWLCAAILLIACSAFAQDGGDAGSGDGGLFGGDGGGLFGGGGGGNGGGGNRGQAAQAPDRLVTLKEMLAKGNAPLSKDQEKALNTLLDEEIKAMSESFHAKFGQEPAAALGAQRGGGGARGEFRGGRGAGAAPVAENPMGAEIRRMNEELLAKVTSSLKPEQQTVIKKFQNDQIRRRGGLDALRLVLEDAGAPALTAEQIPQIQALYAEQAQARIQMVRESQGQPDPAKLSQLELGTMTKVTRILSPEQRKALLDSMAKSRQ